MQRSEVGIYFLNMLEMDVMSLAIPGLEYSWDRRCRSASGNP